MKISAKQITLAVLTCLSLLQGMAKAACNNANGTTYILEIGGYTASTVELGVINTFTLKIKNEITGDYLTSGQIDASAITWVPGSFTVVSAAGVHAISISLVAGTNAVSSSPYDLKTITCRYEASGWTTDGNLGCQVSTSKYCINTDVDGDGLTYLTEIGLGSDPMLADTSGDGLLDGWMVSYGFDPLSFNALTDSDGDGFSNLEEQEKGSDPTQADSSGDTGTVATIRYYYDEDDRLTDFFCGTEVAQKTILTAAHNISEGVSVK